VLSLVVSRLLDAQEDAIAGALAQSAADARSRSRRGSLASNGSNRSCDSSGGVDGRLSAGGRRSGARNASLLSCRLGSAEWHVIVAGLVFCGLLGMGIGVFLNTEPVRPFEIPVFS
jgi:hypothetical protein